MDKTLSNEIAEVFDKPKYRFKDGRIGTIRWDKNSSIGWGVFTATDGEQFTVVRHEVEKL